MALVTGASRGIGRSIAERLGSDGATVAVHFGRNSEAAAEVVHSITSAGGAAFALQTEFTHDVDFEPMWAEFDELSSVHGVRRNLDILVNNAGVNNPARLAETSRESFDQLIDVNFRTPFFLTQSAITRLNDGGRIVNLSTGATRISRPDILAYASTKGAIEVFTLGLAKELGPRAITVNAVSPGIIDTDMNSWLADEDARRAAADLSVMGRVGEGDDVADVVAFLVSSEARWITGQVIDATGGSRL